MGHVVIVGQKHSVSMRIEVFSKDAMHRHSFL